MIFVFPDHLWSVSNDIPELPYQDLKVGPRYVYLKITKNKQTKKLDSVG